ncbi:uncharacterized protein LOC131022297 isoform X2 [Salvia miltiorrhiza]|uniref:uncharacterized protein LOC131022297 isoform X2 n=1 Tax=Salvia miltiorrhiza TaxID=226208 RepID=UPI0025ABECB3|nr:uncharacterized protein LOC131022297 isoform X2 [Salvia miltiorrhiza]
MMLRSSAKPPLARSPIRLRSRRKPLQPAADNAARTPPGSLTKSQMPNRSWDVEQSGLRPEYHTISCELSVLGGQRSPLFERGRFYDEYCARRNERLFSRRRKVKLRDMRRSLHMHMILVLESSLQRRGRLPSSIAGGRRRLLRWLRPRQCLRGGRYAHQGIC